MLKRLLSMSMACALCMTLATTAFAAEGDIGANTAAEGETEYVDVIEYTVQAGDTLGHISVNYYGNYDYHTFLAEFNSDNFAKTGGKFVPGMIIDLPIAFTDGTDIIKPAVAGVDEALYTVKAGDTLGTIAQAEYDNAGWAHLLYERNNDRLKSVNLIYEGQVIVLPVIEVTETAAPATTAAPAAGNGALAPGAEG